VICRLAQPASSPFIESRSAKPVKRDTPDYKNNLVIFDSHKWLIPFAVTPCHAVARKIRFPEHRGNTALP
jgi:hypothetical protein